MTLMLCAQLYLTKTLTTTFGSDAAEAPDVALLTQSSGSLLGVVPWKKAAARGGSSCHLPVINQVHTEWVAQEMRNLTAAFDASLT